MLQVNDVRQTRVFQEARAEGREEGREEGQKDAMMELIRLGLKDKFGSAGLKLMPKVRALNDLALLRTVTRALMKAERLDTIRKLLP